MYCECGCGELAPLAVKTNRKYGAIKGQPQRYRKGHFSRKPKYECRDCGFTTPCWVWLQHTTRGGYGQGRLGGRIQVAHRYYYEQARGPIPTNMQLDHLCRNRRCVNPAHLEPVTAAENVRRGRNAKLTSEQVVEIRRLLTEGWSQSALAKRFDVSPGHVCRLASEDRWTDGQGAP